MDSFNRRCSKGVSLASVYRLEIGLVAGVDVLPSKPRRAGRQMHWNNIAADSPFPYWKFAFYNAFVDNIVEDLDDQFTVPNSNDSAQNGCGLLIDHQACVWARHQWWKHLTWSAGVGKPIGLRNRTPQAHWQPHWMLWMLNCIQTSLLFCSFDDSSDHCHCWKIFQLDEKNENISSSYHYRYQA